VHATPAIQSSQSAIFVAAESSLFAPSDVQVVFAAGHDVQAMLPASENEPGGQGFSAMCLSPLSPSSAQVYPARQNSQIVEASVAEYLPGTQRVQLEAEAPENFPGGQGSLTNSSPTQKQALPAEQATQAVLSSLAFNPGDSHLEHATAPAFPEYSPLSHKTVFGPSQYDPTGQRESADHPASVVCGHATWEE